MDGHETEYGRQNIPNVRELTEEIDRSTDLTAPELSESKSREFSREQAGNIGGKVLTYNPDQLANPTEQMNIANTEHIREMTEVENGYGAQAMEKASLIGAETEIQAQERLAEDREDIANEQGLNGSYVKKIMDSNNKRITHDTVDAVDRMISRHDYHPGQLDELMTQNRTTFLKDVFNRILGSRN